ncbi:MAG: hypothetical protein ACD_52C00077G0006 [uncultured bacterium]|nr:MAG: hypothetical protein ACD_52C00077G0006 [uncultured bacterium]
MVPYGDVFVSSFQTLWYQLMMFLPKVLVALVIWVVGKSLIGTAVNLLKKIEFKGFKLADKALITVTQVISVLGKFLLVLIVLDYLGIAKSLVDALFQGLSFAVAIALGLAFGKAFEDDAKHLVNEAKRHINK